MLVHISDIIFSQTGQSSLQIVCKTHELQIVNSTFIGGRNGVDISIIGTVLKAILMGTTFSHNRIGSLITRGMLNKSSLDIQNCTFSNNVVTDSSFQLFSLHSIVIMFSCFERNFADTIIKVENVINMSISDTCFHSNVVQTGSVVYFRSNVLSSLFIFDNNFVSNNTVILSDNGILSIKCLQNIF